jgi:Rad3-related DNA helicase
MNFSYIEKFPYKKIRDQQKKAIEFALDSFINKGKKFCIIEAGTGVGKSAIGVTVSRVLSETNCISQDCGNGAYFLTTQKILQDQYEKDFGTVISLKSSSNYTCDYHKSNTCSQSQQLLRTAEKGTKFFNKCAFNCKYKKTKKRFLESQESITNFPYFLTESNFSGKITKRKIVVIDEGHNIESELSKFVEVSVTQSFAKNLLGISFPQKKTQFQIFKWITDVYLPAANKKIAHFERMIQQFGGDKFREKLSQFQKITRQFDLLNSHVSKLNKFVQMYDKENWVFDISRTDVRGNLKATFKPIDVSQYSEDVLFHLGEKILIMSATIIDKNTFCKTLGIPQSECSFITLPSPFDPKNRPVIFSPVGSMSAKNIDKTLPKLSNAVREILDHHSGEKGIIHCKTFKIANYLKNSIKSNRIITHDSSNRDEMLKKHIESKSPTVLLSPSMTEGVDLKDDSSRFQIICKVPFPYLGDKLIKKRMNKFPGWYNLQTAKTIVQSAGRSVRNDRDHASTYILDLDFERFISRNRHLFPTDFINCLIE